MPLSAATFLFNVTNQITVVSVLRRVKETLLSNKFWMQLVVLKIAVLGILNLVQCPCKCVVEFFLNKPNMSQLSECY